MRLPLGSMLPGPLDATLPGPDDERENEMHCDWGGTASWGRVELWFQAKSIALNPSPEPFGLVKEQFVHGGEALVTLAGVMSSWAMAVTGFTAL